MVKVDLKTVYKVTSKGRTYYYAWKGKGAPRLLSDPGSADFIDELQAALASRKIGDQTKVSGLCAHYRASDEYKGLADTTKRNWTRWLDRIQTHFGLLSIRQFDRPQIRLDIRRWRDKFKDTPRSADYGLQVLSRLMSFAVAEGLIASNPVTGIPHIYRVDRSELIWTDDDLARVFEKASPELVWAGKLAAYTGLRLSDLLKLSWSHVQPLAIEMRTAKSGGRRTALIPLYGDLATLLKEIPKRATTVLTNTRGQPWRSGFSDSWRDACARAEIGDLHFHDLRGTAATRMFVAGLTVREIAEILAWSEDRVERLIDRYVKRDELLLDRIRRLDSKRMG
ncbi:MAG: tyrosine-type recombinase/integrase [Caulobacteraceae bacterium]